MSTIERLRTVVEAEQRNDSLASGQPYDDDATVNWTNEVRPVIVLALLDVAEAWADLMRYGQAHDYRTKTWWATVERGNAALARLDGAS